MQIFSAAASAALAIAAAPLPAAPAALAAAASAGTAETGTHTKVEKNAPEADRNTDAPDPAQIAFPFGHLVEEAGGNLTGLAHQTIGTVPETGDVTETETETEAETEAESRTETAGGTGAETIFGDETESEFSGEAGNLAEQPAPVSVEWERAAEKEKADEAAYAAANSPAGTNGANAADGANSTNTTDGSESGAGSLKVVNPCFAYLTNPARIWPTDYRMMRKYPLSFLPKELNTLVPEVRKIIGKYDGKWSIYIEDLRSNTSVTINDQAMKSASVMKLFIMETVYDSFASGELPRTADTVALLRDMISHSSNEAANRLLLLLGDGSYSDGIDRVNLFIRTHGYSAGTQEYNGFAAEETIVHPQHNNQITAKDVGTLLSRVYHRHFLSRTVCSEIEQMLLDQGTRYKIPKGIPGDAPVQIGNKTGEMDVVQNDAAIIYGPDYDYILVVLSQDWEMGYKDKAMSGIQEVSARVYKYFSS